VSRFARTNASRARFRGPRCRTDSVFPA
jgi:hypothetical protein